MSLRQYFKPVTKLPSHSQTELPANVLRDVNQAVTAVLQRSWKPTDQEKAKVHKIFHARGSCTTLMNMMATHNTLQDK